MEGFHSVHPGTYSFASLLLEERTTDYYPSNFTSPCPDFIKFGVAKKTASYILIYIAITT